MTEGELTQLEDGTAPQPLADEPREPEDRKAMGLAIAGLMAAVVGFVSFFRLTSGWDERRARAFRRLLGVQVESLAGVTLGLAALHRLRHTAGDRRGIPLAVGAVVLGVSNLVRSASWLRPDR